MAKTILTQLGELIGARLKTLAEKIATALSDAKAYTDEKIAALVDSAPETLDTLKEIADQITDNKTILDAITDAVTAHQHDTATAEKAGFMSAADKSYLDSIGTFDDFLDAYNTATAGIDYLTQTV